MALDDLEGRIVAALDEFKLHPGSRTSSAPGAPTLPEELADILRPVLEGTAHVGPAVARSHGPYRPGGIEGAVDAVYRRVTSDLALPAMLQCAQADPVPAKRAAALQFFHGLHRESRMAGSYLDATGGGGTGNWNAGPYGEGGEQGEKRKKGGGPGPAALARRRALAASRRAELLRYWVEASAACTAPGTFTDVRADGAVASRAVLSAGATLRPSLRHISDRIGAADDAGATRLYRPMVRMVAGVLRRLFVVDDEASRMDWAGKGGGAEVEALRSSCVKFLEIVVDCFSTREEGEGRGAQRRRKGTGSSIVSAFCRSDGLLDMSNSLD